MESLTLFLSGRSHSDVFAAPSPREDFSGGLQVQRLPHAGHFLHREQADDVNERIIAWLNAR